MSGQPHGKREKNDLFFTSVENKHWGKILSIIKSALKLSHKRKSRPRY